MRISDWSSDVCSSDLLRLWCVPGFAAQWLSEQLANFGRQWPELTIEMRPTDDPADLIMHQADIDIRFYGDSYRPSPGGKGLRFVELARPPFLVVANQVLAAELSKLQHISELADGPLLHARPAAHTSALQSLMRSSYA